MSHVIRLAGGVEGLERYPELLALVGEYVLDYRPELAREGEQWLWTTPHRHQAREFPGAAAAFEYCAQAVGTRPWDGRPDRPISVFHVEIKPKEDAK